MPFLITLEISGDYALFSRPEMKVENLKDGFELDEKNPHRATEETTHSTPEILEKLLSSLNRSRELVTEIKGGLK